MQDCLLITNVNRSYFIPVGNRWVGIPPRSQSSQSQQYTSFKKVLFQIEQENLSLSVSQTLLFLARTQQYPST